MNPQTTRLNDGLSAADRCHLTLVDIVELPAPGFYYQCHRCKVWRHCQRDDKDKYRSRVEAAEKGLSVSEVIQLRLLLNEHGYGDITADPHFAETYENFSRRLNAKKVELGPQEPDQWAEYLARKEGA